MEKKLPIRSQFYYFRVFETRWDDNDIYGHINNNVHFRMFDTTINCFLLENKLLDLKNGNNIYLAVETNCRYFKQISYPESLDVGINISHLGNTSIIYNIGIFKKKEDSASALGKFVHVNIDKRNNKPSVIDDESLKKFKILIK